MAARFTQANQLGHLTTAEDYSELTPDPIVQRERPKPVETQFHLPGRTVMAGPIIAMLGPGHQRLGIDIRTT